MQRALMQWHTALSRQGDTLSAGLELLTSIEAARINPDLLLISATPHHAQRIGEVTAMLLTRFPRARLVGGTAGGVIGSGAEIESGPGLAVTAARLPDVEIHAAWMPVDDPLDRLPGAPGPDQGPVILALTDPWSQAPGPLLDALDARWPGAVKLGGMLSGGTEARMNRLLIDDRAYRTGSLLVTLHGDIKVDTVIAPGCRPVGPTLPITGAEDNRLLTLDGRPALEVLEDLLARWSDAQRQQFRRAPLVGISPAPADPDARAPARAARAAPARAERPLTRNLIGIDRANRALLVGGTLQAGDQLCFQVRDGQSAREDLEEQLSRLARASRAAPPAGALLFSCQGRGAGLFGAPDHESARIRHHLGVHPGGFFASGEIGTAHGQAHLHGYTAAIGVFSRQGWD